MHPMLKPALRRGWRSRDTIQFGVARAHAVVMGPVDTATGSFLELLDGTRGLPLLRQEARAIGLPEGRADALVDRLAAAGLLDEPRDGGAPAAALDRLRPDAGALSVLHPEPGAAARLLGARRAMRVQVRGAGRVGAAVAAALSGSGIGRVDVVDGGRVEPWDVAPGGLSAGSPKPSQSATCRPSRSPPFCRASPASRPRRPLRRRRPRRCRLRPFRPRALRTAADPQAIPCHRTQEFLPWPSPLCPQTPTPTSRGSPRPSP